MEEEIPVEEYSASINEKLLVEKDKTKASGNAQDEKKLLVRK
jgi:hypothetical protein